MIPSEEKDRVLGFLIKSPGLITRKYNGYIPFESFQKCPYCYKDETNIVRHMFKCPQLF